MRGTLAVTGDLRDAGCVYLHAEDGRGVGIQFLPGSERLETSADIVMLGKRLIMLVEGINWPDNWAADSYKKYTARERRSDEV